jgi:WD40 repeat protein
LRLAFSPDGRTLASLDGTLWDVPSGRRRGGFNLPCQDTSGLRFSHDGRLLALGGDESAAWLWDVETGKRLQRVKAFSPGEDFNTSGWLFLSPDGRILVIATDGLEFWDVPRGKRLHRVPIAGPKVNAVAFSPDGRLVATGHLSRQGRAEVPVRVWDVASGKALHTRNAARVNVQRLAFTRDGKALLVACEDETIRLWDVLRGRELRRFDCPAGGVDALAVSPDGKLLAVGGSSGVIMLLDLTTGRDVAPGVGHSAAVLDVSFSPDGSTLATGGGDRTVRVWDGRTGRLLHTLAGHRSPVQAVTFSPDGRVLATAEDGRRPGYVYRPARIHLWDAANGSLLRRYQASTGVQAISLAFSPDGGILAAGDSGPYRRDSGWQRAIRLWGFPGGAPLPGPSYLGGEVTCLAFAPTGRLLAYEGAGMRGGLYDVAVGQIVRRLEVPARDKIPAAEQSKGGDEPPPPAGPASALAFTPDGKMLVGMEQHCWLVLWETATGKVRARRVLHLPGNAGLTGRDMALSSDGRLLATVDVGPDVCVWDLDSLRRLGRFRGHRGTILALAFSPDGRRLASASADTTALIWDVSGLRGAPPKALRLNAEELMGWWAELENEDAPLAYRAVRELASAPSDSVPWLSARLRPVPPLAKGRIARLLADLEDRRFAVRQQANTELATMLDQAEPALRRALAGKPSPELRRRLEALLAKPHGTKWLSSWRALEALERAGTPEAGKALEELAKGDPDAEFTREAAAGAKRLAAHLAKAP